MKVVFLVLSVFLLFGADVHSFSNDQSELAREVQAFFEENDIDKIELEISEFDKQELYIEEFGIIGSIQCSLCMSAFNKVVGKIPKGAAKNKIRQGLDKACNIIPTEFLKNKCRAGVEKRGDTIAEFIANNLSSAVICKLIAFYADDDFEIEFTEEEIEELGIISFPCALCLKVMNKLISKIPKGTSKEKVKAALDKACNVVPTEKLKAKCHDVVAKKGDQIAGGIVDGLPAALICKFITFC